MTEPITDETFYNEHAALVGHVALAWNDCHSVVLSIFHTLSGVSWHNASSIFLALKSDHDRRETTLALMDQVLNADNDRVIRDQGTQLIGQLGNLGYEGTVATHTMWVTVMRQRKVSPHPDLPDPPKDIKEDFKSQFSKLTTDLCDLFRELLLHHSAKRHIYMPLCASPLGLEMFQGGYRGYSSLRDLRCTIAQPKHQGRGHNKTRAAEPNSDGITGLVNISAGKQNAGCRAVSDCNPHLDTPRDAMKDLWTYRCSTR